MRERYIDNTGGKTYDKDSHPFGQEEKPVFKNKGERLVYWFKNSFYSYRPYVIAAVLGIVLVVFFIYNMIERTTPDFQFAVISTAYVSEDSVLELEALFSESFTGKVTGYTLFYQGGDESYFTLTSHFLEPNCVFFIYGSSLGDKYFSNNDPDYGSFTDLSLLGYETPEDRPWAVDVTGLPLLVEGGIEGERFYASVMAGGDEKKLSDALMFLDMLLSAS